MPHPNLGTKSYRLMREASQMLLSHEVAALAKEFIADVQHRPEFANVAPPQLLYDDNFWQMIFDAVENTIHHEGYVIVRRSDVETAKAKI